MSHELIPLLDRHAWEVALEGLRHPHAHTFPHVSAFHASRPDDTFLYVHRTEGGQVDVACPLARRGAPGEQDVYTPYGFGGFATTGAAPSFADEWRSFAASQGWVASYVFQNPVLGAPPGFGSGAVHPAGTTYVLDLATPEHELLARMSSRRRAELRRWRERDVDLTSDHEEVLAFLLATSDAFFDAREAAPVYRLTATSWEHLVGSPSVWCVAAREADGIIAASVFGESCGLVDYLFGISRPGASSYSAPLVWEAVLHFASAGASSLNLGGGIRPGDGVAEFKRRFGPAELEMTSARLVHRPDAYGALCRRAGVEDDVSGFFPPYRRVWP